MEIGHLRLVSLSFRRRSLASSLPVAGSTVSTVGMDPLSEGCEVFCKMLQVLKVAFTQSKLAESGQNREQSISMVQTLCELIPQPP